MKTFKNEKEPKFDCEGFLTPYKLRRQAGIFSWTMLRKNTRLFILKTYNGN